jgi:hypothetical protein
MNELPKLGALTAIPFGLSRPGTALCRPRRAAQGREWNIRSAHDV